jgi:N-acyl-D-aspartate/D-glutamate deacylase
VLDVLIRGADVVDGTGAPRRRADVGVAGGRVVAIGAVDDSATATIDAGGLVVTPGFVDLHTHYDAQLLWDPFATPSPLHGVTTVIGGNCGFSIAPLGPGNAGYIQRMMAVVEGIPLAAMEQGGDWDWDSFGEWLDRLDGRLGVNAGFLAGHSTIRRAVMGEAAVEGAADDTQLAAMVRLLHESIEQGALGLSSSLDEVHTDGDGHMVPSRYADLDEFVALAGALRDHDGTTLEFIPSVGEIPADRMQLMTDMALAAGRTLNWNLLGSLSPVEIYEQQLAASDLAAEAGARVVALSLPDVMRLRASNMLGDLPVFKDVMALDDAQRRAALADPDTRRRLGETVAKAASRGLTALGDFNLIEVAEATTPATEQYVGKTVAAVAAERGTEPVDALIDVVLADRLPVTLVLPSLVPSYGSSDEGWVKRAEIWDDERVVLGGSDAGAHLDLMCHANYTTRLLGHAARDRGLLDLETAVHKVPDVPARLYGLRERGRVAEGWHADLVVLDAATVDSAPARARTDLPGGGERLYAEATGIERVLVGGRTVVDGGRITGDLPGTLLRAGRDTTNAP